MRYSLKMIFRSLGRNVLYSWINVLGLAVSLTAVVLILLWVQDELAYDGFYQRSKDIYMVRAKIQENYWRTPTALTYAARTEIPGVESACSINRYYDLGYLEYENERFFDNRYISVDTTFFRIFDRPFLEGSAQNALPDPYAVVLTKSLAHKIFGQEPALGKLLRGGNGQNFEYDTYIVSGVIPDPSPHASLQYDAVFSFERSRFRNSWDNWSWEGFLLLSPQANKDRVCEQLLALQRENDTRMEVASFYLQPLKDLRLHAADGQETGMASVRLFFLIALGLLGIACINYVNLTTARAHKRGREVAVKKIIGAKRGNLIMQMLGETLVLTLLALCVSLLLLLCVSPYYTALTGKVASWEIWQPFLWRAYGGALVLMLLLSGIYPACKLSRFAPLDAFKEAVVRSNAGISLRKALIVLQFVAVALLLVGTWGLHTQLRYIHKLTLGYQKEGLLELPVFTNIDIRKHYLSFKEDLEREPLIKGVTASKASILSAGFTEELSWDGMAEGGEIQFRCWGVDRNLRSVLGIPLLTGTEFLDSPVDSRLCYLNETAVKRMGLEPDQVLGKRLSQAEGPSYTVIGVLKDFHFENLWQPISPLMVYLGEDFWTLYVQIDTQQTAAALEVLTRCWERHSPVFPLSYSFLEDAYMQTYSDEAQKGRLFSGFALVAILISCLGLFGLVSYTAETRTKELGIRKVLGADTGSLIWLLLKEFLILLGVALLLAFPLAYYSLQQSLQAYAYRPDISPWAFLGTAGLCLLLVLLTVGGKALKAAVAKPVDSIKTT